MRVVLLFALVVAALFLVPWELTVSGEFAVAPRHNADVRAEVDGIIAEVYVDEGQRVAAGELVARLADRDYRAELRAVERKATRFVPGSNARAGPRVESACGHSEFETAETRREHARRRLEEAERMQAARLAKATADVAVAEERLRYARNDLVRSGLSSRASSSPGEHSRNPRSGRRSATRSWPLPGRRRGRVGRRSGVDRRSGWFRKDWPWPRRKWRKPGPGSGCSRPGAGPRRSRAPRQRWRDSLASGATSRTAPARHSTERRWRRRDNAKAPREGRTVHEEG